MMIFNNNNNIYNRFNYVSYYVSNNYVSNNSYLNQGCDAQLDLVVQQLVSSHTDCNAKVLLTAYADFILMLLPPQLWGVSLFAGGWML